MAASTSTKAPARPRSSTPRNRSTGRRDNAQPEVEQDDSLERKYRAREAAGDTKSTADYVDEAYEQGRAEGEAAKPAPEPGPSSTDRAAGAAKRSAIGGLGGGLPSVAAPLAIELVLIAADELVNNHRLPLPSRLLSAFGLFGVLGAIGGQAESAASAVGWGLVVATFYATVGGAKPKGLSAVAAIGDFMAGKYGNAGAGVSGGSRGTQAPGPYAGETNSGGVRRK